MMISADGVKLIFKQNIKIISTLMDHWAKFIAIDKILIVKML